MTTLAETVALVVFAAIFLGWLLFSPRFDDYPRDEDDPR